MDSPFAAAIAAAAKAQPSAPEIKLDKSVTLVVDGDYAAYACAGNDETSPGWARTSVIDRLFNAQAAAGAGNVVIHLSARDTHKGYRSMVSTVKPYQGQRDSSRKPVNWGFLRDYLESLPNVVISSDREADDSIAEAAHRNPKGTAIYTADKDMRMLPGLHVDWKTYELQRVEPDAYDTRRPDGLQYGTRWFWLQMLHGDTADNIPGLPKCTDSTGKQKLCGPVTAEHVLADCTDSTEAFDTVATQYIRFYGKEWSDRFVEQASLLWLRRAPEAHVADFFLHVIPLNKPAPRREIARACQRMVKRVKERCDAVEAIRNQTSEGGDPLNAEW